MRDPNAMFEHRLGSLLGKTIKEVRAMPATEYHRWELFYLIEPWGWHNTEYLFGKLMSVIAAFSGRTQKGKKISALDFMREDIAGIKGELEIEAMIEGKSDEEIREMKKEMAKRAFGIFE
jgi:hypothetical protein